MKTWILPLLVLCSSISYGQLTISASTVDPLCNSFNGALTGEIDVTVTGGIAPLSYLWTTSQGAGLSPLTEDHPGIHAE